ncbi:MAG: hypothetical protein C3F02_00655 [Parcubacteria group bacterium]|nr:MAG: hypothetical protein C3F02_00655 [Parcubacteria group bacterium]
MPKIKPKLIVVIGPTASGKSALAVKIAKKFNGEIISADSRQIYKDLDIGANKTTQKEMAGIPHHLLDIARPNQKITLFNWQRKAFVTINKIITNKKIPILCGGTGLYLCSVLQNYKMPQQSRPCPYDFIIFGLSPNRPDLYKKIDQRVLAMLQDGLIKEVDKIYRQYPDKKLNALTGIGYKEIIAWLDNKISFPEAVRQIQQNTRHYAKRQMTWFRRMEKQGFKIHWNLSWPKIQSEIKKF